MPLQKNASTMEGEYLAIEEHGAISGSSIKRYWKRLNIKFENRIGK